MQLDFSEVDEASRRVYRLVQGLTDDGFSPAAILSALAGAVLELGEGSDVLDSMKLVIENQHLFPKL